jgi:ribonucleoside-diphosphate reductase alpha chain
MGHIKMMAAVQPFVSGAISKTVNMPSEVTQQDIMNAYMESWSLGLKAVALYRDGCKSSQPLNAGKSGGKATDKSAATEATTASSASPQPNIEEMAKLFAAARPTLRRRRLPKKRFGFTQEAKVGGQKVYLRTGNYEDGSLGEIFVDLHKEGAAFRSMMNCFAIAVSLGLQYGVPLEDYVDVFTFTRFDPQGPVDHPNIKWSTSVIDYTFRLLAMEYLGRTDFVQVKPADGMEQGLAEAASKDPMLSKDFRERIREFESLVASTQTEAATREVSKAREVRSAIPDDRAALSQHLSGLMGDAPFCDTCGHITVRNGACYKCLNCGASMGCS